MGIGKRGMGIGSRCRSLDANETGSKQDSKTDFHAKQTRERRNERGIPVKLRVVRGVATFALGVAGGYLISKGWIESDY